MPPFCAGTPVLAVEPWSRGAVEPWSRGAVEPWSRGAVEPWSRGAVEPGSERRHRQRFYLDRSNPTRIFFSADTLLCSNDSFSIRCRLIFSAFLGNRPTQKANQRTRTILSRGTSSEQIFTGANDLPAVLRSVAGGRARGSENSPQPSSFAVLLQRTGLLSPVFKQRF
jgi:hypothetical protein